MKVLVLNYTDGGGGAALASYRLAKALNENGVCATLGVVQKQTASPFVVALPRKKNAKYVRYFNFLKKAFFKISKKCFPHLFQMFSFSTTNNILHSQNKKSIIDVNAINNFDCDIVNLHWVNADMLSIKDISRITKSIVWTMHDSWPCSGAEHHPNVLENDTRWKDGYFKNNKPASTQGPDICLKVWNQKKKYLSHKKIIFTAPSKWEHDVLKSSALFKNNECFVVPNIVNKKIFFPHDKKNARSLFGIPKNKKVIGFGAAYDIDNPKSMKGSSYLIDALQKFKNPEKYFLVIFGPVSDAFTSKISIPFFSSGYISNPVLLACLYSICDCIINPSLIENLPNVCLESIFCGVPVVAFDVGGTSDIVEHKKTGYLASPYDTMQLAEGVEWCLSQAEILSRNCLKKAKTDFDESEIIKKMIGVYERAWCSV